MAGTYGDCADRHHQTVVAWPADAATAKKEAKALDKK